MRRLVVRRQLFLPIALTHAFSYRSGAGCLIEDATDQRSKLRGSGGDGEATEYGNTQGIKNGGG